jgi:hypothetical protein
MGKEIRLRQPVRVRRKEYRLQVPRCKLQEEARPFSERVLISAISFTKSSSFSLLCHSDKAPGQNMGFSLDEGRLLTALQLGTSHLELFCPTISGSLILSV